MSSATAFYLLSLVLAFVPSTSSGTGLMSSSNPALLGQPVEFTATIAAPAGVSVSPTGTVTFTDNGQALGTVAVEGGVASFTTEFSVIGSHKVIAEYSGDANFQPENSPPFTETITDADLFTISVSPPAVSQAAGGSSTVELTLFSGSTAAGPVQLSCQDLPAGVSCSFPAGQPVPSAAGTTSKLTIASTAQQVIRAGATVPYVFAALLFPVAFLRRRRLWISLGALLLLAAGCSTGTKTILDGTPPGSYVVQVVGNDGTTVQTAKIQLNVTQ